MNRLTETGDPRVARLHEECQRLKDSAWQTPDIGTWIERLGQHLAVRGELDVSTEPLPATEDAPDTPQIEQGIREHGDAFRAYLHLPDINRGREELLTTFQEHYVDTYTSIDELLDDLTEVRDWEHTLNGLASQWGVDGLVSLDRDKVEHIARQAWDIIERGGSFHVFIK
jgi:hypothetical protein